MADRLAQFQEVANRGLQDSLSPDKRTLFDEAVRRGMVQMPGASLGDKIGANLTAMGKQLTRLPAGIMQTIGEVGGLDPIFLQGMQEGQQNLERDIMEAGEKRFGPAAMQNVAIGEFVGDVAPWLIPATKATSIPGIIAREGGLGFLEGATRYSEGGITPEERLQQGLTTGALSAVLPAGLQGVKSFKGAINDFLTGTAGRKAAKVLTDKEAQEAAELMADTGVVVFPSGVKGDKILKDMESKLSLSTEDKVKLQNFIRSNEEVQRGLIGDLLETVDNPATRKEIGDLYSLAAPEVVPDPSAFGKLLQDKETSIVFNDLMATVRDNPVLQARMEKFPEGSVGRWDILKKELDDNISASIRGGSTQMKRFNKDAAEKTKGIILDVLDEQVPAYREARQAAFRSNIVKDITEAVGADDISNIPAKEFYKKVFADNAKHGKDIRRKILSIKDETARKQALKQFDTIRDVSRYMLNSGNTLEQAISTGLKTTQESGSVQGTLARSGQAFLDALGRGRYNRAIMEAVTSGKWADDIAEFVDPKTPKKDAAVKLALLLNRVAAQQIDLGTSNELPQ